MPSSRHYKSILFAILVLVLASCVTKKSTVADKTESTRIDIVDYGKRYLHKPYLYAGRGPNAFDCSGYTSFVFGKFGYKLEESSAGQARQGTAIYKKEELEIGDLVFFEGRSRNGRVGHVGIVSDKGRRGQFKFIHASTTSGVIITSSDEPYYQERYLRGGRIIKETPKVVDKEEHAEQYNYAMAQDSIVYKETNEGFVAINSGTGKIIEGEPLLLPEQTSKPVKSKKPEEKKRKKGTEIRQAAIRGSEESLVVQPNRVTHKVKPGETLYSISQAHSCSVEQLKKWNPEIKNNVIKAGDELNIYQ